MPFTGDHATAGLMQEFIESQTGNVFWFTPKYAVDEESRLAEYDYRSRKWAAGRFIGEAFINYEDVDYKITIRPRFGEKVLFRMLEVIFNIRITLSAGEHTNEKDWQHFIKKIIAFIWLQKLADANLHGLPKKHSAKEYKGTFMKGRLEIRNSVKPFCDKNEVVSSTRVRVI